MKVFRIKDWGEHFENSSSRKLQRMTWVAVPLKHGTGYRRLLAKEDGAALYGAWMAIVTFAATCPVRGTFARADGKPYSFSDIAIVKDFSTELIKKVFEIVSNPDEEIEWIEECQWENPPVNGRQMADSPGDDPENGTSRETMGDDGRKASAQNITKTGNNKDPESPDQTEQTPPPPPEVQSVPAEASKSVAANWGVVAKRLKDFGVKRAEAAVKEARQLEFTAERIIAWVDWLEDPTHPERKEKIGPGAIVERIQTTDARQWAVDFGWPPINTPPIKTGTVLTYPYQKVPGADDLSEVEQRQLKELNAEYGSKLDAMDDVHVTPLIGKTRGSVNVAFHKSNSRFRLELLIKIRAADRPAEKLPPIEKPSKSEPSEAVSSEV